MKRASIVKIARAALGVIMGGVLFAGCAGPRQIPHQDLSWHQRTTGAYETGNGKVFYGIGKAASLQNHTLQRVSADNQARLEMARLLERFSTVLANKASSADIPEPDRSDTLSSALKALVNQAMQRAIVIDHWSDPQQGHLVALCRLTLEDYKAALNAHRGIGVPMRLAMLANLEVVHAQLSQGLFKNK